MPRQRAQGAETSRPDLYRQVTDEIIAALAQGVRPWVRPWSTGHLETRVRRPLRACGQGYRGINVLMLWLAGSARGYHSPFWLTFKQALELGGHVRKGERGSPVCYYDTFTREKAGDDGTTHEEQIPFLKHYTVFNAEQCDGLPAHLTPPPIPAVEPESMAGRIETVDRFIAHLGADIGHGGNRACYALYADRISMPPFPAFASPDRYYSTLLHELIHWTRHPSRLDRDCGRKRWGDAGYAREELVAELGSAFLCADLAVSLSERDDHASYIASWLEVLANDKRAIFHAAALAERAAAYLHSQQPSLLRDQGNVEHDAAAVPESTGTSELWPFPNESSAAADTDPSDNMESMEILNLDASKAINRNLHNNGYYNAYNKCRSTSSRQQRPTYKAADRNQMNSREMHGE